MRTPGATLAATLVLASAAALAACEKTGEGEYQIRGPDVDKRGDTITIGIDTATVRVPTVEVGRTTDTLIVGRPTVDVDAPGGRRRDSAPATKRP